MLSVVLDDAAALRKAKKQLWLAEDQIEALEARRG
jgi:hypothetical protein